MLTNKLKCAIRQSEPLIDAVVATFNHRFDAGNRCLVWNCPNNIGKNNKDSCPKRRGKCMWAQPCQTIASLASRYSDYRDNQSEPNRPCADHPVQCPEIC